MSCLRASLGLVLAVALIGAAPATKPAARPKPDPNSTAVINDEFHFTLFIPKKWEKAKTTGPAIAYSLPTVTHGPRPMMVLVYGRPHEGQATLDALIDVTKKQFVARHPEEKLLKDEKATFAGEPGWQLVYNETINVKQIDTTGAKSVTKDVTQKVKVMKWLAVKDGASYIVTVEGSPADFDSSVRLTQNVIASWQWTEPADAKANAKQEKE